jgi:hypothetical protein
MQHTGKFNSETQETQQPLFKLDGITGYNHRLKDLKSVPMLAVLETASSKDPTEIVI